MTVLAQRPTRAAGLIAALVLVLVGGCAGGTPAPPESPAPPPVVTATATATESAAPSPSSLPRTPGTCDFTLHLGTGAATTSGNIPQIPKTKDGLFVSCGNGPLLQLRGDRVTPALAVDFEGKQTRLVQGDTAIVGPYRFRLLEQSGNGGRQLRFELTLS